MLLQRSMLNPQTLLENRLLVKVFEGAVVYKLYLVSDFFESGAIETILELTLSLCARHDEKANFEVLKFDEFDQGVFEVSRVFNLEEGVRKQQLVILVLCVGSLEGSLFLRPSPGNRCGRMLSALRGICAH